MTDRKVPVRRVKFYTRSPQARWRQIVITMRDSGVEFRLTEGKMREEVEREALLDLEILRHIEAVGHREADRTIKLNDRQGALRLIAELQEVRRDLMDLQADISAHKERLR